MDATAVREPANPKIHETTTGPEIWTDTQGMWMRSWPQLERWYDHGRHTLLASKEPELVAIAVEPEESTCHPVADLDAYDPRHRRRIRAKNLDKLLINEVQTVSSEEAFYWARRLAREEGILGGISSGANIAAAIRIGSRPEFRDKRSSPLRAVQVSGIYQLRFTS